VADDFIEVGFGPGGAPQRFAVPLRLIVAATPGEVAVALLALDAALAEGHWVAGFASYELGYAVEPRLAPLMPAARRVPLLAFGVYGAPGKVATVQPAGSLGPFVPAWSFADYAPAFHRLGRAPAGRSCRAGRARRDDDRFALARAVLRDGRAGADRGPPDEGHRAARPGSRP
jgi:hypothetical protein